MDDFFGFAYTDEIYSFNLLSRIWRKENVVRHSYPLKRDFHTAQYMEGKLYVFGGNCKCTAEHFLKQLSL